MPDRFSGKAGRVGRKSLPARDFAAARRNRGADASTSSAATSAGLWTGEGRYEAGTGSLGKSGGRIPFPIEGVKTPRRRGDSARRVQGPDKARLKCGPPRPRNSGGVQYPAKSRKSPPFGPREKCGGPFHETLPLVFRQVDPRLSKRNRPPQPASTSHGNGS